jgi:hypothetical protein
MRFLAERTQFRRDRVVVPIARKHLLPDPLFFRCHLADDPVRQANDLVGQRIDDAMNTRSDRIRPPRPIESSQRR